MVYTHVLNQVGPNYDPQGGSVRIEEPGRPRYKCGFVVVAG